MKREIARQIYAYTVCAVSLIIGIIFFTVGIYGIVKIAAPEFTISRHEWEDVATFQSYKTEWERAEGAPDLTDQELRMRWQDKKEIAIMGEKRQGAQNLINMIIAFVIIVPLFGIHWRIARSVREE
ncbi:MAG: hypothetical protein ACE5JA_01925 [bacterium]